MSKVPIFLPFPQVIPDICPFWYNATFLRPEKVHWKCVNSQQNSLNWSKWAKFHVVLKSAPAVVWLGQISDMPQVMDQYRKGGCNPLGWRGSQLPLHVFQTRSSSQQTTIWKKGNLTSTYTPSWIENVLNWLFVTSMCIHKAQKPRRTTQHTYSEGQYWQHWQYWHIFYYW